eukprot:7964109-Alexandrium_andersonii.AAC.1
MQADPSWVVYDPTGCVVLDLLQQPWQQVKPLLLARSAQCRSARLESRREQFRGNEGVHSAIT